MRRMLGLIVACVASAAMAQVPNQDWAHSASPQPFDAWLGCLNAAASKLDDGKADASVVARAVAVECEAHYSATILATVSGDKERAAVLRESLVGEDVDTALQAVVAGRAAKRS